MYPVTYDVHPEYENRNRLTVFFRLITAIPIALVASLYVLVAYFAAIIAWFALVITGRYPEGLYNFNAGATRILGRANGYFYLLTDQYPAFNGKPDQTYPVVVDVAPPKPQYSRLKALFRLILAIPVYLLYYVWAIVAEVCAFLAWFAIVFTGKLPNSLATPITLGLRYVTRALAYAFLLITEDYPPFSQERSDNLAELPASGTPAAQPATAQPAETQPGDGT
jgi:hypothetical protein